MKGLQEKDLPRESRGPTKTGSEELPAQEVGDRLVWRSKRARVPIFGRDLQARPGQSRAFGGGRASRSEVAEDKRGSLIGSERDSGEGGGGVGVDTKGRGFGEKSSFGTGIELKGGIVKPGRDAHAKGKDVGNLLAVINGKNGKGRALC